MGSPRQGGLRWDHFMVQLRTLRGHTQGALCGGCGLSIDSSRPPGRAATAGCSLCLTKERMFLLIDCSKELDRRALRRAGLQVKQ